MLRHSFESRALCEEITYGIDECGLPVIVVYPELPFVGCGNQLSQSALARWDNLECLKSRIGDVPTAHIPFKKEYITNTLNDSRFSVHTKSENCTVGLNSNYELGIHQIVEQIDAMYKGRQ